jgi:hypothetical protein
LFGFCLLFGSLDFQHERAAERPIVFSAMLCGGLSFLRMRSDKCDAFAD